MKKRYTEKELKQIWRGIQGATPDLFIPVPRARWALKTGLRLAVFNTYSEVSGDPDAAEKYWERLAATPLK